MQHPNSHAGIGLEKQLFCTKKQKSLWPSALQHCGTAVLCAGKFVMEHAVEKPYWMRQIDHSSYGYRYRIMARLSEPNQTFFRLKFQ